MPKKNKDAGDQEPVCDWQQSASRAKGASNTDRIYRHAGGCRWRGVATERYKKKGGGWSDIARNVLIGNCGESTRFHLRYFEIASGGYSSLESHRHEHVVVCIKGKGKVRLGGRSQVIRFLDTVYIAPNTIHQLSNPYEEPFGFFCIVNAKRDKPKLMD
ncbi:MAG TPA: cupin domain-containing protein [Dissulfurispiraceae bacterium]|nr:cupin domain-containing protein [Dissulfurispiraceae bacterium]